MKLSELQRSFARAIKNPDSAKGFLGLVRDDCHTSPSVRLEVYQSAYRIRMVESLRDDFARLEGEVGEAEFRELAEQYLGEQPSRYASLAEFSQGFPEFVRGRSPAHFGLAARDWIEILASLAAPIPPARVLSAEEIQGGAQYRIVRNPTLHPHVEAEGVVVAFRTGRGIATREFSPFEHRILSLFTEAQTADGVAELLSRNKLDENSVLPLIAEWVGAEILHCVRS